MTSPTNPFPYLARRTFFNRTEGAFYRALEVVARERYLVFPKVRLLDICDVSSGDYAAMNRVSAKHVDFVLCDRNTYRPIAAIEVDGSSHERRDRVARDEFVNGLFARIGLPLLRFPATTSTTPAEILARLTLELPSSVS